VIHEKVGPEISVARIIFGMAANAADAQFELEEINAYACVPLDGIAEDRVADSRIAVEFDSRPVIVQDPVALDQVVIGFEYQANTSSRVTDVANSGGKADVVEVDIVGRPLDQDAAVESTVADLVEGDLVPGRADPDAGGISGPDPQSQVVIDTDSIGVDQVAVGSNVYAD